MTPALSKSHPPQIFYLIPVLGICFNIFPVNNSFYFALAFTLYLFMIQVPAA